MNKPLVPIFLSLVVAACGGSVAQDPSPSPTPTPATTAIPTPVPSSDPTPTAPGSLGPTSCSASEAALVVAADSARVIGAFQHGGTWSKAVDLAAGASSVAAFEDQEGGLGAFYVNEAGSGFRQTSDGVTFTESPPAPTCQDVSCFAPVSYAPLVALSPYAMLGTNRVDGEVPTWVIAGFDPDAKSWTPQASLDATDSWRTVSATTTGSTQAIAWRAADGRLTDRIATNGVWSAAHAHDDAMVVSGGEIAITQVALANDHDEVAAIYQGVTSTARVLAATTRHEGTWTAPVLSPLPDSPLHFAATSAPSGDIIVAGIADGHNILIQRYSRTAGWTQALLVGGGALSQESGLAAAPGICGDDALFAYASMSGEVFTVRVRDGLVSRPLEVGQLASAPADGAIALITRRAVF